jgi:predicted metal-dependent hydrolase
MESKYQDTDLEDDVLFLKTNYSKENRYENVPGDIKNTSYTINKGTETKLCLRDLKTLELHDFETLLFVNFHELSHLFDYNIGHHPSFWRKFAIVLQNAKEMDLYTPVNYKNYPEKYCGIIIDYNPYYTYIVS